MIYSIRSALAIGLAIVACACAMTILLQDALRSGVWTIEHALLPGMIVIAILSGHLTSVALASRRYVSSLGFAVAFGLATVLTLYTSVSRQAELISSRRVTAETHEAERAAKTAQLHAVRVEIVRASAELNREMTNQRCLDRCKAWRARLDELEDKAARTTAELMMLSPSVSVSAGAEHVAAFLTMTGAPSSVKTWLVVVEPFARAWLFELTAIVAFGFAFRPRPDVVCLSPDIPVSASDIPAEPVIVPPPPPTGGITKEMAEQDLVTLLALGRTISSQEELAKRWRVPKVTVSRWLTDFERRNLIARTTVGRAKQIVAA